MTILRDTAIEGNETFYLRLRNPVNASIQDSLGAVIIDDGIGQADLQISMDYKGISVHNSGASTATSVRLRIHALDSTPSDCAQLPCQMSDIHPGDTATYYIRDSMPARVVFGAEVSANETDLNMADNKATVFVQKNGSLDLSTSPAYPLAGSAARFTFIASSHKPGDVLTTSSSNMSVLPFRPRSRSFRNPQREPPSFRLPPATSPSTYLPCREAIRSPSRCTSSLPVSPFDGLPRRPRARPRRLEVW